MCEKLYLIICPSSPIYVCDISMFIEIVVGRFFKSLQRKYVLLQFRLRNFKIYLHNTYIIPIVFQKTASIPYNSRIFSKRFVITFSDVCYHFFNHCYHFFRYLLSLFHLFCPFFDLFPNSLLSVFQLFVTTFSLIRENMKSQVCYQFFTYF